ncbi:Putative two-component sensor histidine kinase [hydrothermal vent metagenome]|uniref:Putative two-component sensor histidine kinase n=1 Tax=hydrothermal vent metagenome TaxID=652676 RepID=A0A1W1CMX2_9ZZZZ
MKFSKEKSSSLNGELERENPYLAGILDATVNIIILRDNNKKLLYINRQFSNYFPGYKNIDDFDRDHDSISELFDTDDDEYIDKEYFHKNFDYIVKNEIEHKVKITYNNKTVYFKLTITKSKLESSRDYFVIILSNITRLELERKKCIQQERLLQQQAKMASMGEMIGNIAHQWRQPLNALSSLTVLLGIKYRTNKGLTESDMLQFKVKSNYIIQNMSKTIDDFKNFFSPNKSKERFCIRDAINEIEIFIKNSYLEYNIELVNRVNENIEIVGYKSELEQVFLNILNNSKDAFIEQGRKILKPTVTIDVTLLEDIIRIEIVDNAGGIEDEIIDRIFEPYFSTKFESNGTGIGLYMSKMIIEESMGGKLLLENRDDGVVAIIEFPSGVIKTY